MKAYKISFEIKSSTITPFQSDTLWGYFAWACFHIWGEKFGKEFIDANKNSNPTLVSNAYPEGYLPVPIIEIKRTEKVQRREIFKQVKKRKFIRIENFEKVKDGLEWDKLFEVLVSEVVAETKKGKVWEVETHAIMRNKINRLTFTTSGVGELFGTEEIFYSPRVKLWFAVKTDFLSKGQIEAILKYIELSGFGADASIGKGDLKFTSIEDLKLPESENPNAFMTISNFIPTKDDLNNVDGTNLWYKIFTKYPKVGGHFALADPFKKPLVFMEAGSVFKVKDHKEFYGQILNDVHSNPDIVQFAYAFPLKVRVGV
ncbi:MAG: type III-A CRISPR-associated RAMP protein Csm4 [Candidatus Kryptonium sp.]